jgi:acetyl esterase/lipase
VDSDVNQQRRQLRELASAQPLPAELTVTAAALGGVPTAEITVDGAMSPYADLTLAGTTMETKREADPLLSRELLQPRVTDYAAGQDAALGLISPIFADLSGLPPLIIQAGTHEVLLDDALRLAQQAATADVEVTLDITPRVPHVFQAYHPILDEAAAALDRAGQLLSAHLARADRVTA